jgi:hypothetical protein
MEQMSLDTGDIFIELYEQNTYIYWLSGKLRRVKDRYELWPIVQEKFIVPEALEDEEIIVRTACPLLRHRL